MGNTVWVQVPPIALISKMTNSTLRIQEKELKNIPFVLIGCIAIYLLWVASYLQIDYHDSYFVLLNARCIATGNPLGYTEWRPVILPLLLSPILFLEKTVTDPALIQSLCHLAMVAFFLLLLWAFYRFLRLQYQNGISRIIILLFALNPLLIHSAPYCKEDVAGLLLIATSFLFYLKSIKKKSLTYLIATSITLTLAIGIRFNFFLVPLILGAHSLIEYFKAQTISTSTTRTNSKQLVRQIFFLLIAPALMFVVLISFHYSRLGLAPFTQAFASYLQNSMFKMADLVKAQETLPALTNVDFLARICGWFLQAVAVLGIAVRIRRLNSFLQLNLLWLVTFLALQTFVIQYKEIRFLIPILPPLFIFFIEGCMWISEKLNSNWPLFKQTSAGLCILFCIPILETAPSTFAEIKGFQDPVYTQPFAKSLSEYASNLAQDQTIYWVGHFYSLHPKHYAFDRRDVTYSIYHLYVNALAFYSRKYRMSNLRDPHFLAPEKLGDPIFIGPNAGAILSDGDVLVINLESDAYVTSNMPKILKPLYVERARKVIFHPKEISDGDMQRYYSAEMQEALIQATQSKQRLEISGRNIPSGRYEIYVKAVEIPIPIALQVLDIHDGTFHFLNSDAPPSLHIEEIFLLYFDSTKEFHLPR